MNEAKHDSDNENKKKTQKFNKEDHPQIPKSLIPSVKKNSDGTWGPTGLYGGRVKETPVLKALRDAIKPSRLLRYGELSEKISHYKVVR